MNVGISFRTYIAPIVGGFLFFVLVVLGILFVRGDVETTSVAQKASNEFIVVEQDAQPSFVETKKVPLSNVYENQTEEDVVLEEPEELEELFQEVLVPQIPLPEEIVEIVLSPEEISSGLSDADIQLRSALVNIICIASSESPVGSISGSGVIIDSKGTILTNAHIAQVFLLKDYPKKDSIDCTIRTGNIAKRAYKAELAYISPIWIVENKTSLVETNPTGTGENDFAFLSITESATNELLPQSFNHVVLDLGEQEKYEPVLAAGYPASFLASEAIRRNLVLVSSAATVQDVFTFEGQTVDVLSLGGVPLAQQGSSGGAVANLKGELIGIVVTSSLVGETAERDLRAITLGHIARSFKKQTGVSISSFLLGDLDFEREQFSESVAPLLKTLLLKSFDIIL